MVPCLQEIPSKCSAIVQTTMATSLDRCYIPGKSREYRVPSITQCPISEEYIPPIADTIYMAYIVTRLAP